MPENWCWTYQKAVCSLSTGEKRIGNDYPYWEVKCLRGITLPQIVSSGNFVPVFSKVILVDGENSGEVFTILTSGYMGSTFRMLQISAVVFPKYLELFILSNKDVYRNRKTGSAIPHLNKELFFQPHFLSLPLPSSSALLTASKACLPSWMRPRKRHRPCWIALKPAKPLFSTRPSPVN